MVGLLAEDVVFRSPIVFKPYRGREADRASAARRLSRVRGLPLRAARSAHPTRRDHALVFEARVGDRQIEGCDFLHTNEDGLIDEFVVMVRPLSGALALAEAMQAQLLAPTRGVSSRAARSRSPASRQRW